MSANLEMIRVQIPFRLQTLSQAGAEVAVEVQGAATPLPEAMVTGRKVFMIVGAISGG